MEGQPALSEKMQRMIDLYRDGDDDDDGEISAGNNNNNNAVPPAPQQPNEPDCTCTTLVVVPSVSASKLIMTALKKENTIESNVRARGVPTSLTKFTALDDTSVIVTVSMANDKRARIDRLHKLVANVKCTRIIIVSNGYTVEDLQARRIDVSNVLLVDDAEFMIDVLGMPLDNTRTGYINNVFGGGGAPTLSSSSSSGNAIVTSNPLSISNNVIIGTGSINTDNGLIRGSDADDGRGESSVVDFDYSSVGRIVNPVIDVDDFFQQLTGSHRPVTTTRPRSRADLMRNDSRAGRMGIGLVPPVRAHPTTPSNTNSQPRRFTGGAGIVNRSAIITQSVRRRQEENAARTAVRRSEVDDAFKDAMKQREEDKEIEAMCVPADHNTCTICMTSHVTSMLLPCLHFQFCHDCITEWLKKTPSCPICKRQDSTVVQPRTKFNVQEEHRRRKRDDKYLEIMATTLEQDAAELRTKAQGIKRDRDDAEEGNDIEDDKGDNNEEEDTGVKREKKNAVQEEEPSVIEHTVNSDNSRTATATATATKEKRKQTTKKKSFNNNNNRKAKTIKKSHKF